MSTISQYDLEVIMQSNGSNKPDRRGFRLLKDPEFFAWCHEEQKVRDIRPDQEDRTWPQHLFNRYVRGEIISDSGMNGLNYALLDAYHKVFKLEWYESKQKERRSSSKSSVASRRAEKKAKARARGRAEYEARLTATGKKKG